MNQIILVVLSMFAISAHAEISGTVFVNSSKTEAKLLVNEVMVDGELSKFFDQMKIAETGTATKIAKTFALKNGRFGLTCNKGVSATSPTSTSCTFVIKHGASNGDINTYISKLGNERVATISMTQVYSAELEGVFPTDPSNSVEFVLSLPNSVGFEARGATFGNMSIGFFAR